MSDRRNFAQMMLDTGHAKPYTGVGRRPEQVEVIVVLVEGQAQALRHRREVE
jgi:endonuclease YncB( thermonuclease family)